MQGRHEWTRLRVSNDGPLAEVRFDNPPHNGVDIDMVRELQDALREISLDRDVHVVVLTGEGPSFCPGANLAARPDGRADAAPDLRADDYGASVLLHEMPQVTVAAINGACAGAGLAWASACDLRVASDRARFSTAFLAVGVGGDMGGAWTLPRIIGGAKARELWFLPEKFSADEALTMGLVSRVFPDESFRAEAADLARHLASFAPAALRTAKANFVAAERMGFADYMDLECERHFGFFTGERLAATAAALRRRGESL